MSGQHWGLDIRVWDVELGTAIWAKAADKDVVIDLGANDFSPIEHLDSRYDVKAIDYMIVTHPHKDHIRDILRLTDMDIRVKTLTRNQATHPLLKEKIEEEDDESYLDIAEGYLNWQQQYTLPSSQDPTSEDWANGATVTTYSLDSDEVTGARYRQMNSLSIITVIERGGFKMVSCGDLLKGGIKTILADRPDIMNAVEDAHVLVAPHHGRESGYNSEFVGHIDPEIILISDKTDNGNNADGYYQKPNGVSVYDEPDGEWIDNRCVLTTRKDGRLRVRANHEDNWMVSYYDKFADRKAQGAMAQNLRVRSD